MTANTSFGNYTSIANTTEELDVFCVRLPVGPLIWAVFSVIAVCVGVPASLWLLWVLIQRQRSSTGSSNNVYMLNLTIMDLIYNVYKIPDVSNYFVWRNPQLIIVGYFFEGLNAIGHPLLMACSCVDCYMAVVHPIRYMKIRQSRYRVVVCVLVWVVTLVLDLILGFGLIEIYVWYSPCIMAISTITFCDIAILRALRKPDPSGRTDVHPQKQRALQTITNSFFMTLMSYLPMVLLTLIPDHSQELYCHVFFSFSIFPMLGSTILPLLYLGNLGRFSNLRAWGCIRSKAEQMK